MSPGAPWPAGAEPPWVRQSAVGTDCRLPADGGKERAALWGADGKSEGAVGAWEPRGCPTSEGRRAAPDRRGLRTETVLGGDLGGCHRQEIGGTQRGLGREGDEAGRYWRAGGGGEGSAGRGSASEAHPVLAPPRPELLCPDPSHQPLHTSTREFVPSHNCRHGRGGWGAWSPSAGGAPEIPSNGTAAGSRLDRTQLPLCRHLLPRDHFPHPPPAGSRHPPPSPPSLCPEPGSAGPRTHAHSQTRSAVQHTPTFVWGKHGHLGTGTGRHGPGGVR